ncbi:MAG: chemotaxis protein CheW [Phycisphaeraceae bacterium]|nr:chemotaxis protein CheW [Phycisphaeraceae bacterium]
MSASTPPPHFGSHSDSLFRLLERPLLESDVRASTEDAASPAETGERGRIGVVLFGLGNESLALPASVVRRVTAFAQPVRIPHRSGGVLRGVCNVRGELVLCADLRRLLGMPAREDANTEPLRTMVIGPASAAWAFEVDALHGIGRVDPSALASAPLTVEHALGAFVAGLAEVDNRPVTVLDGERILAGFKAALA